MHDCPSDTVVGEHGQGKSHRAIDTVERMVERAMVEMDNVRGIIGWDQAKVVHFGSLPVASFLGSASLYTSNEATRNREVADLVAAYRANAPVPPIAVERIGDSRYRVIDGYHRILALTELAHTHVEVIAIARPQSLDWKAARP